MLPPWSIELAHLYWRIRSLRTRNLKRNIWRKIATQKKRLIESGVSYIEVHLVTRYLATNTEKAAQRLRDFYANGKRFE